MSAYICNKAHFLYLVQAATSRRICGGFSLGWTVPNSNPSEYRKLDPMNLEQLADVANMLMRENIASVAYRYPSDKTSATLPGPVNLESITADDFRTNHWDAFDPVQVLKACNCLEYQSCEHPAWETSEAETFLRVLKAHAIASLPGYDDAEWGAPETYAQRRAKMQNVQVGQKLVDQNGRVGIVTEVRDHNVGDSW